MPAPEQVAPPVATSFSVLKMFPESTSPPAECTMSVSPLIVSVSCASSEMFWIVYVHAYGSPIFVGLTQPFVNAIPCWTGSPGAANAPTPKTVAATASAPTTNVRYRRRRARETIPLICALRPSPFAPLDVSATAAPGQPFPYPSHIGVAALVQPPANPQSEAFRTSHTVAAAGERRGLGPTEKRGR